MSRRKFYLPQDMGMKPFANFEPFLQLLMLISISFVSAAVFMFAGHLLVSVLWGVDIVEITAVMQDFESARALDISRFMLLFQHLGLFVVPPVVFAVLSSTNWRDYLGFRSTDHRFVWGAILLILLSLPSINALSWLNELLVLPEFLADLERLLQGWEDSAAQLTAALTETGDVRALLANLFVIAVVAAVGEEMIFRGLILPILRRWTKSAHLAVWISALMFSAMHLQFYGFLPRLVLGALLGYLFVWSRSLWIPIIAHFTNNALALLVVFLISRGTIQAETDTFSPQSGDWFWLIATLVMAACVVGWMLRIKRIRLRR